MKRLAKMVSELATLLGSVGRKWQVPDSQLGPTVGPAWKVKLLAWTRVPWEYRRGVLHRGLGHRACDAGR